LSWRPNRPTGRSDRYRGASASPWELPSDRPSDPAPKSPTSRLRQRSCCARLASLSNSQMPTSMLAAKKAGSGKANVIEVALPEVPSGHVLVHVRACAICASDLPEWNAQVAGPGKRGEWDADNPGMTGHEIAGDIVQ